MTINTVWFSVCAVCFVLVAGIAGNADYADAVLAERAYCANVTLYHAVRAPRVGPTITVTIVKFVKKIKIVKNAGGRRLFCVGGKYRIGLAIPESNFFKILAQNRLLVYVIQDLCY